MQIHSEFDIDKTLEKINQYVSNLGYSKDISKRFEDMYIKEMYHLIDMHNKVQKLNNFKRLFKGFIRSKEDFIIKGNKELFEKSIINVNAICRQILRLV